MAAGAPAIMSASQVAGRAKGFVLPPALHLTSLTSQRSGLTHSYTAGRQGTEVFELGTMPRALTAESIGYSELPSSLCHSDFCFDAFSSLFLPTQNLLK